MKTRSLVLKYVLLLVTFIASIATLLLPLASLHAATLTNNMNASYVLGQEDFTSNVDAGGEALFAEYPYGVTTFVLGENSYIAAADTRNSRVLVYDVTSGITNGMNASYVLGQDDFESTGPGVNDSSLFFPLGVSFDEDTSYFYVSDAGNNRVVVFNLADGITNGESAIRVLGQADFSSQISTTTQSGLDGPTGVLVRSGKAYVADTNNHRVMVFDVGTITNGENAVSVLGQADFVSGDLAVTQSGLWYPADVALDEDQNLLFVHDRTRVLVYDIESITNGENAVNVLGEPDFTSTTAGGTVNAATINDGYGISFDDTNQRLFVADGVARIVIFDLSGGITNGMNASYVLGQNNSTSSSEPSEVAPTQNSISVVGQVYYDTTNDYFYVMEGTQNRLLIFDLSPSPASASSGMSYVSPPLCQAFVVPESIVEGESVNLSWRVEWPTGRTGTYYTKVPGVGLYPANVTSVTVQPNYTTTYRLAIFNLWGANFCDATITVLDENGQEITSNKNSHLTAGVSNSPFAKALLEFFKSLF